MSVYGTDFVPLDELLRYMKSTSCQWKMTTNLELDCVRRACNIVRSISPTAHPLSLWQARLNVWPLAWHLQCDLPGWYSFSTISRSCPLAKDFLTLIGYHKNSWVVYCHMRALSTCTHLQFWHASLDLVDSRIVMPLRQVHYASQQGSLQHKWPWPCLQALDGTD